MLPAQTIFMNVYAVFFFFKSFVCACISQQHDCIFEIKGFFQMLFVSIIFPIFLNFHMFMHTILIHNASLYL